MNVKKDGVINKLADKLVNLLIGVGVNWSEDIRTLRKKVVEVKVRNSTGNSQKKVA